MVADLLQAHQGGQHQPLALDAIGLLQLLSEVFDGLRIERRLLARQWAEGFDLGLVRQVGDDTLVGLKAAQDGMREPVNVIDGNYHRMAGVCPWWDGLSRAES